MTEEEKFIEGLYDEANEQLKEVYKEQKENRDKLLQAIAMIILNCTVLDGLMSLMSKDKRKEYKRLSKLIINATGVQRATEIRVITNILNNTVKKTFDFYNYNHKQKDVKKVIDRSFKGKHFSDRVWENEQEVAKKLHKEIDRFLNGKVNVNQIKKDIEKTFNTNAYNSKRLVETEVNRCSSGAFDRFCKETGVKKVRYNAILDSKLCSDCARYHDKVFDFNNKIELPRHPLCRCFYTIEDDNYKKSKVVEEKTMLKSSKDGIIDNKGLENKTESAIKDIKNGKHILKILEGKQGKHILGHNNYIEGRSYLTISLEEAQELVNKYAGTGEIRFNSNNEWNKKEIVKADKDIGMDVNNKTGERTSTNRFKIHYSDKGTHIVPMRRE